MNHWKYKNREEFEIPLGSFGFVYRITDLNPEPNSPSIYIGRKYLTRSKTTSKRVLKKDGTKITKKKKSRVESEWQSYMGSCKPLLDEIKKKGKDKFRFEILSFANTRGQVNFLECLCQMKCDVLTDDSYYNDAIGSGQFRGVRIDRDFKNILKEIIL